MPVLIEYNKYLNNIINQDIEATINSFIDTNKQMIHFQQELLNEQLEILKENYDVLLQDEISKLQENLLIAKALGYKKNYFFITPQMKNLFNMYLTVQQVNRTFIVWVMRHYNKNRFFVEKK